MIKVTDSDTFAIAIEEKFAKIKSNQRICRNLWLSIFVAFFNDNFSFAGKMCEEWLCAFMDTNTQTHTLTYKSFSHKERKVMEGRTGVCHSSTFLQWPLFYFLLLDKPKNVKKSNYRFDIENSFAFVLFILPAEREQIYLIPSVS